MKTLTDVIVVKRDPLCDRSKGGIILLSEQFKNEERGVYWGTVLVAGPKCRILREGDRVAFARTTYVKYDSGIHGEVCGLHEADVLVMVEPSVANVPN